MFETPFTAIISGASGTGKTEWIKKLLKYKAQLINNEPKHVLYCYGEINPEIMKLKHEGIELFNGVPTKADITERPSNMLLILDDLITDIDPKFLEVLYTRGSHHWNVSVITVTQNLFDRNLKVARINSQRSARNRIQQGGQLAIASLLAPVLSAVAQTLLDKVITK